MSKFLDALRGQPQTPPPCWFMRQAGRYLPEYREVREKAGSFMALALNPDLATEVTLQPIRRYGLDAAIVFSDILMVPYLLGQELTFKEGEGPVLGVLNVPALKPDLSKVEPVFETLRRTKAALPEGCALIGFAGSPWTVACYMIEGHSSPDWAKARQLARSNPAAFEKIMDKVIDATISYVEGQIKAGADVIQLFDSWAGQCDNPQRWVIEPTSAIVLILKSMFPKVPIIGFPRGLSQQHLSSYAVLTQVDGLSLCPKTDMAWAVANLPKRVTLQGNLAPELVIEGGQAMRDAAKTLLEQTKDRPFVFNLGHGLKPETPPEHVAELVSIIRGTAA